MFAACALTSISMAGREALPVASFTSGTRAMKACRGLPDWWGHELETRCPHGSRFSTPRPAPEGWQVSNPPVIRAGGLAGFHGSVRRGRHRPVAGQERRTDRLSGVRIGPLRRSRLFPSSTPRDPERRGAQLSIRVPGSVRAVCERWRRGAWSATSFGARPGHSARGAMPPLYTRAGDIDGSWIASYGLYRRAPVRHAPVLAHVTSRSQQAIIKRAVVP